MNTKFACVVEVSFCESQNIANKTYHYYVPDFIAEPSKALLVVGGYVVVNGAQNRKCLCEIKSVLSTEAAHTATKAILGVADLTAYQNRIQRDRRRNELVAALEAMEQQRQERARFEALAGASSEARGLLDELRNLDGTVSK